MEQGHGVRLFPLWNFSDREICSSDQIHPDNPVFVRSFSSTGIGPDDTFCYTGAGAALNDINGTERDPVGIYYDDGRACHAIVTAGYEVPGAKRPATRSFPAPGSIMTNTAIVWRPVSPTFTIANGAPPAVPQLYLAQAEFLTATGATPATGSLPNIGEVIDSATVGSVTFSLAPGGESLAIGASGSGAEPDWYGLMAGHEIALGYESLQVQTAAPVFAMGFVFAEPNTTMPAYGGTPGRLEVRDRPLPGQHGGRAYDVQRS